MKLGNLENVLEQEQTIYEALQANMKHDADSMSKTSLFSKILKKLSSYGMEYSKDIKKNLVAVPIDKGLQNEDALLQANLYGGPRNNWYVKQEEDKSFSEKNLNNKIDILRKMAMQPELENILDKLANEGIVYDDELTYVCKPFLDTAVLNLLNEDNSKEIKNSLESNFYRIYTILDMRNKAWNIFKKWLIDGVLCYEIVFDNRENPKAIIDIVELDPTTLTKKVENGLVTWIQYEGVVGFERKLLDAEIIYIKYEDSGVIERQSYLERLIRAFNIYRIVEQAQVIWTVSQSSFKTVFKIPVKGQNRTKMYQTLNNAMSRYKEDVSFNVETGELKVNGRVNMPFNKEFWMPDGDAGTPEIETLVDQGPSLNDSEQLRYFETKLIKMSKIPANRFDTEAQATWFGSDPTQALREEIDYSRFVTRLHNTFGDIILKPLRIQIALSLPDIKNDKRILDAVSIQWNSYNQFEEMANIEIMSKRIEFIGSMKDSFTIQNGDEEEPFFDPEFLIVKYLKMSDADLELNRKYKLKHKLEKKDGGDEESGGDEGGAGDEDLGMGDEGGGEEGGGSESDEGGDIDSEMLGDVQPESPETSQA